MIFTRPAAHIQSDFADDCLPCHHIYSVYSGQIHATDSLQLVMQIKPRDVAVFSRFPFLGRPLSFLGSTFFFGVPGSFCTS